MDSLTELEAVHASQRATHEISSAKRALSPCSEPRLVAAALGAPLVLAQAELADLLLQALSHHADRCRGA